MNGQQHPPRGMNWNSCKPFQQNYGPMPPNVHPFGSPPPIRPMYNQNRFQNSFGGWRNGSYNNRMPSMPPVPNQAFMNGMDRFPGPHHIINSHRQNKPQPPWHSEQTTNRDLNYHNGNKHYPTTTTDKPNFHANQKYSNWGTSNGNQKGSRKKKKGKVDKRDLPENNNFFCDSCDRGFKMEEKYQEHVSQHQRCHIEGCSYIAAPKLVQLHTMMQHRSGLAKHVWNVESKEEINTWIAERKRHYPTAQTVERKKALASEKQARGEILENKSYGKMNDRNGRQNRKRHRKRFDGIEDNNEAASPKKTKVVNVISTDKELSSQTSSRTCEKSDEKSVPLSNLLNEAEKESNEDSGPETLPAQKQTYDDIKVAGGLKSLMVSYQPSDTDPGKDATADNKAVVRNGKPDAFDDTKLSNKAKRKKNTNRMGQNRQRNVFNFRKKASLLQKLLAPDIRHERNIILQCAHYIVKNNFFASAVPNLDSHSQQTEQVLSEMD